MACQIARDCPDTRIVSVADCEADIYDIFVEAQAQGHRADFLIRAKEDRATPERNREAGPAVYRKVRNEVRASPLRIRRTIPLSQTPKRAAREAQLEIRALRVLHLTVLNRECPDLPCDAAFAAGEWESVWQIVKKEPPPKTPPRLGEFLTLVAELGGYNNRVNDPAPGPQVLWQGLRRMLDFAIAWAAFQTVQQ